MLLKLNIKYLKITFRSNFLKNFFQISTYLPRVYCIGKNQYSFFYLFGDGATEQFLNIVPAGEI